MSQHTPRSIQTNIGVSGLVRTDLHAGFHYGDWTARLYVNNTTNRRSLLHGGPSTLIADSYYYITPRTMGLNVPRDF